MKIKDTGWKQEMDALYERTRKNWENTGKAKKAKGVSGIISLAKKNAVNV